MSAIITDPPILIDPVNFSRQSFAEINPMGPWMVGSNLYMAQVEDHPARTFNIFKSTDSGLTWTPMDAAHSPGGGAPGVSFNAATGIIKVILQTVTGQPWFISYFDTATDTWVFTSSASSVTGPPNFLCNVLAERANGDMVYIYVTTFSGPVDKLAYLYYNQGSNTWNAEVQLITVTAGTYLACGAWGTDGIIRFVLGDGNTLDNTYYELDLTLTLSAGIFLGGSDGFTADIIFFGAGLAISWTDYQFVYVAIALALPGISFTRYTVQTVGGAAALSYARLAVDITSKLTVFWVTLDYSSPPYVDEVDMATYNGAGSWIGPILFYDEIANPPANSVTQINQFAHTGEVIQLPSGQWVYALALEVEPAFQVFCAGHILTKLVSSTLTLPCPIVTSPAVVGQPFTETLIASGGTPPYTYGVAVGYALPPALTLDPTTGLISGIPTAIGVFEVAYTVTDSLGNTARTIGTCPIPVGQQGSPCENPGANPSLDSYLELRKVLVAWKKETHLPVRGKS